MRLLVVDASDFYLAGLLLCAVLKKSICLIHKECAENSAARTISSYRLSLPSYSALVRQVLGYPLEEFGYIADPDQLV